MAHQSQSRILKFWLHFKNWYDKGSIIKLTILFKNDGCMSQFDTEYSLIQKNGYTFAIVYSSKCVSVFLNQTLPIGQCKSQIMYQTVLVSSVRLINPKDRSLTATAAIAAPPPPVPPPQRPERVTSNSCSRRYCCATTGFTLLWA